MQTLTHPTIDPTSTTLSATFRGEVQWSSHDPESPRSIIRVNIHGSSFALIGPILPEQLVVDQTYRFLGRWEQTKQYGQQFQFSTFIIDEPVSESGVIKYLTTFCEGIFGAATARKLLARYGSDAVKVLREEPGRVSEDRILSLDLALEASTQLARGQATERTKLDLFGLLDKRGFRQTIYESCIYKWGVRAPSIIRRDPFKLLTGKLPGAGFKRTDKLWCDLGLPRARLKRQTICGWNVLRTARDGHTWIPERSVQDAIEESIKDDGCKPKRAIELGVRAGWFARRVDDKGAWIAEASKAHAERRIAHQIECLLAGASRWPVNLPVSVVDGDGLPSEHQKEKALLATGMSVGILAGGPGVGKTHCLAFILKELLHTHSIDDIAVCAPTGKAAVRATQSLERVGLKELRATTIHTLLEIGRNGHDGDGWRFNRNRENPLDQKFIIIDEGSMVDATLLADLFDACLLPISVPAIPALTIPTGEPIPPRCRRCRRVLTNPESWKIGYGPECAQKVEPCNYSPVQPYRSNIDVITPASPAISSPGAHVLIIGDPGQLPPVGHGAPLRDLILSNRLGFGELTEVRRNAGQIVQACVSIRAGRHFETSEKLDLTAPIPQNLKLIEARNERESITSLETVLKSIKKWDPVWDTQVIVPLNKKSLLSRVELNNRLKKLLNPNGISIPGMPFSVGDKIVCLRNSWIDSATPQFWRPGDSSDPIKVANSKSYHKGPEDSVQYVANGEIGRVVAVGEKPSVMVVKMVGKEELIWIPVGKSRAVDGESEGADEGGQGCSFDLAYALSCHKCQGSEFPLAIIMFDPAADMVAGKEWVYTAISRASQACVLISSRGVIERQAGKVSLVRRKTFLKELIEENQL